MTSRRILTRDDLFLLALSAGCIAIVAISPTTAVDVVAGLPLTIYLPGAALVSTVDAGRRYSRLVERQVWIIGASFGLTVFGGLVLNLAGGLTRVSWLAWVATVIIICTAVKVVLRVRPSQTDADADAMAPDAMSDGTAVAGSAAPTGGPGSFRVSLRQGLLLLVATAICVAALVLSVHTNTVSTRESFVQAWVLPQPAEDVTSPSVQLGVQNHLGSQRTFLVRVTIGTGPIEVFSVPLEDGASWTHLINRRPGERVESTVSTTSRPSVVTNRVYLATPDT
jgi:hypothetical protein